MVEFLCVLVPLLMLILGTVQFAFIYQAKITLNYAAFETTRAGSLTGARMVFMENAFSRALAPLYTSPFTGRQSKDDGTSGDCTNSYEADWADPNAATDGPAANTSLTLNIDNVACARERVQGMIDSGNARIELINPTSESFDDFGVEFAMVRNYDPTEDSELANFATIPNDNLMYRSALPGDASLQSIQDANLIKTHVSLCFDLIVPIAGRIISEMMTIDNPTTVRADLGVGGRAYDYNTYGSVNILDNTFGAACADNGGIPLYAESTMCMHSAAVEEPTRCRGWCGGTP